MTRLIKPTFVNPRAEEYRTAGGPWALLDLPDMLLELPEVENLICDKDIRLSTSALRDAVAGVAEWLTARGAREGSAVGWQLPNGCETVVLFLATWWVGGIAVPFHQTLTEIEAGHVIEEIEGVDVLLAHADAPIASMAGTILIESGDLLARARPGAPPRAAGHPESAAVLMTTSGSSGRPKTVIHTRRGLAYKAHQLPLVHGTTSDDAVLVPAPLAHMAGVLHAVLHPLGAGCRAVIMDRWDQNEALRLVREEKVTMLFGPPIFALGIAAAEGFTPEAVQSVRLVSSGATPISEAYVLDVERLFGARVKRTYGSTEAPIAFTSFPGDDPMKGWTTDGRPVPHLEYELRDPVTAELVSPPGTGEIRLRGPELCAGYLSADQTAAAFVDGWLATGDLGTVDADGFLTVVGRISGLIIRGGMNIAPAEVAAALEKHPSISQAVALGYPDDIYGERVAAFIVSDIPFDRPTCVEWFAEHGVAKYKVPDRIECISAVPVLSNYQKPDLAALRAML